MKRPSPPSGEAQKALLMGVYGAATAAYAGASLKLSLLAGVIGYAGYLKAKIVDDKPKPQNGETARP